MVPICGACLLNPAPARGAQTLEPDPPVELPTEGLELQALFPELEFIQLIAAGGMGSVFKARQPKLDRYVAVKVLKKSFSEDPLFVARFEREAQALAKLDHPDILTIHDFGNRDGYNYFIMELVDGKDLKQIMMLGSIEPAIAVKLMPVICEAIQFAHDVGITHRDIKPANIMIDSRGRVKIADFGLAMIINAPPDVSLTAPGTAIGTIPYMAPELFSQNSKYDEQADIYSLGVLFYQMLTGQMPQGNFPTPLEYLPELDSAVDQAIMRALAHDPAKRFRSAGEMAKAIQVHGDKRTAPFWLRPLIVLIVLASLAVWLFLVTTPSKPELPLPLIGKGKIIAPAKEIPRLALPPELAAMKKRGGRLRVWTNLDQNDIFDIGETEAFDDFIALDGNISPKTPKANHWNRRWLARRSSGVSLTNLRDFERGRELISLGSHVGILETGEWLGCENSLREIHPGNAAEICFCSSPDMQLGIVLNRDGTLHLIGRGWGKPELNEVRTILGSLTDVVKIDGHFRAAAVLRSNGEVLSWSSEGMVNPAVKVQNVVDLACGSAFWAIIDSSGKVQTWSIPDSKNKNNVEVLFDPGPAFAIRARHMICAAQLADGSWRAWGDDRKGVVTKINQLGPAVDLLFSTVVLSGEERSEGTLLWIEPPALSRVIPLPRPDQPDGRLDGWISESMKSIEPEGLTIENLLTSASGIEDFVRIESRLGGKWAAQRASGETVSPDLQFIMKSGRDFAGESMGFVGIDEEGSIHHSLTEPNEPISSDLSTRPRGALSVHLGSDHGWLLQPNGSVVAFPEEISESTPVFKQITGKLESFRDVVAIHFRFKNGIALHIGGKITTWNIETGFLEVPQDLPRDIKAINSTGSVFMILDHEGGVHTWSADPEFSETIDITPPENMGKARAIKGFLSVMAAQREDHSWEAWGDDEGSGVIEKISSLGPTGDIAFHHAWKASMLYWIKPTRESELPPVELKTQPGRLRGIGQSEPNGKVAPLDLSPFDGMTDLVQVVSKHNAAGRCAVLRSNGEVISTDGDFINSSGIQRLGRSGGSENSLVYIRHDGVAIPSHPTPGVLFPGPLPEVNQHVIDVVVSNSNGLLLLANGMAVPWGHCYHDPNYIKNNTWLNSIWPRPVQSDLTNLKAIAASGLLSAVLKSDGSVLAWGGAGKLELPKQMKTDITAISISPTPFLFAVNTKGQLRACTVGGRLVKRHDRQDVIGITGGDLVSPVMYQTRDGEWHLLDDTYASVNPEIIAALSNLKGLTREAFSLRLGRNDEAIACLIWIEPVDQ